MRMPITQSAYDAIRSAARQAAPNECMGLLAGRDRDLVCAALLLPGASDGASASASPMALREAAVRVRERDLVPLGLWHSHGEHPVFHSRTDEETLARLLPALALTAATPWPPVVPGVCRLDVDAVELVDAAGCRTHIRLLGAPVPGLAAHARTRWTSVAVQDADGDAAVRVEHSDGRLRVRGGGAELVLGLPYEATITVARLPALGARQARLYSLVVNRHAAVHCEAFDVVVAAGHESTQRTQCAIACVPDREDAPAPVVFLSAPSVRGNGTGGAARVAGRGEGGVA